MKDKLLKRKAVLEMTGLSRSTHYRMMATGDFPQPIILSKQVCVWPESVIQTWIKSLRTPIPKPPTQEGE